MITPRKFFAKNTEKKHQIKPSTKYSFFKSKNASSIQIQQKINKSQGEHFYLNIQKQLHQDAVKLIQNQTSMTLKQAKNAASKIKCPHKKEQTKLLFSQIQRRAQEMQKQKKRYKNVINKLRKKQQAYCIIQEDESAVSMQNLKLDRIVNNKCFKTNNINKSQKLNDTNQERISLPPQKKNNSILISGWNSRTVNFQNLTDRPFYRQIEAKSPKDNSCLGYEIRTFQSDKLELKQQIIQKERALQQLQKLFSERTIQFTVANQKLQHFVSLKEQYQKIKKELILMKQKLIEKNQQFQTVSNMLQDLKQQFYLKQNQIIALDQQLQYLQEQNSIAMEKIKMLTQELRRMQNQQFYQEKAQENNNQFQNDQCRNEQSQNDFFKNEQNQQDQINLNAQIQSIQRNSTQKQIQLMYAKNKISQLQNKLAKAVLMINSLSKQKCSVLSNDENDKQLFMEEGILKGFHNIKDNETFIIQSISDFNQIIKTNQKMNQNKNKNKKSSSIHCKINTNSNNQFCEIKFLTKSQQILENLQSLNHNQIKLDETKQKKIKFYSDGNFSQNDLKIKKIQSQTCEVQKFKKQQQQLNFAAKMSILTVGANSQFLNRISELQQLCLGQDFSQEDEQQNNLNYKKDLTQDEKALNQKKTILQTSNENEKCNKNIQYLSTSCEANAEQLLQVCSFSNQINLLNKRSETCVSLYEKKAEKQSQLSKKDYQSLKAFSQSILPILAIKNIALNKQLLQQIFLSIYKATDIVNFQYNFIKLAELLQKKALKQDKQNQSYVNKMKQRRILKKQTKVLEKDLNNKMTPVREGGRLLSSKKILDSLKEQSTKKTLKNINLRKETLQEEAVKKSLRNVKQITKKAQIQSTSTKTPSVRKLSNLNAFSTTSPSKKGFQTPSIKDQTFEERYSKIRKLQRPPLPKKLSAMWKK